jgi:hypothetical protein
LSSSSFVPHTVVVLLVVLIIGAALALLDRNGVGLPEGHLTHELKAHANLRSFTPGPWTALHLQVVLTGERR